MSITRAILKRAPILLCDEPTLSFNSETKSEIMNNLKEISNNEDVTYVIIAQRLSKIQDCNEIVVMDGGIVIEEGSHDELMKAGADIASWWQSRRSAVHRAMTRRG